MLINPDPRPLPVLTQMRKDVKTQEYKIISYCDFAP